MRVRPGASTDEIVAELSRDQKNRLARVERAREREKRAAQEAMQETRMQVRAALEAGVPARVLSDRLGLSLARIYQMRDEAGRAIAG